MYSSTEIYNKATELINDFGTRDPGRLAELMKIPVRTSDSLKSVCGAYVEVLGNRFIVLSSALSSSQEKLILAHELGHLILHRELAKSGLLEFGFFDLQTEAEYEANVFAAHLLIDDELIREFAVVRQYSLQEIADALDLNYNLVLIKLQELNKMGGGFVLPVIADTKFLKRECPEGTKKQIYTSQ